MKKKMILAILVVFAVTCFHERIPAAESGEGNMKLQSPAFVPGGMIPAEYTCDGSNISPPLAWSNVPSQSKSLALIVDDPDAPKGTWIHWVYYGIQPSLPGLPKGIETDRTVSIGGFQGMTSFKRTGYGGPCPPGGTHRYYFKLYALDIVPELAPDAGKKELLTAMKGHVIAAARLMGRYKRK